MPTETVSVTSQVETNEARDYLIAKDYYLDNSVLDPTPTIDFWNASTITLSNPVANQVRVYVQNNVGGQTILGIIPENTTSIAFTDALQYSSDRNDFANAFDTLANYAAPGGFDLFFFHDSTSGNEMPDSILIEGTWDYEHTYGREPYNAPLQQYTMHPVGADPDVSTWSAPQDPKVTSDNELFIATYAYAGYDNDVESPYWSIAIWNREVAPPGSISGEYLGAERRFMG